MSGMKDMSSMGSMSGMGGGMSGMEGMGSMSNGCTMKMLGNWQTINSCFLTSSWHINSQAQFAGTCIGVFLLVVLIEIVRRFGREWDRYIAKNAFVHAKNDLIKKDGQQISTSSDFMHTIPMDDKERNMTSTMENAQTKQTNNHSQQQQQKKMMNPFFGNSTQSDKLLGRSQMQPTTIQQCIRSLLYGLQFAGAYVVMLIAMSFNGYILISIVLGGIVGHFVSTWDVFYMEAIELGNEYDDSQLMGQASTPAYLNALHKTNQYHSGSGACCN